MRHLIAFFLLLSFVLYHSNAFSSNLKIVTTIKPIYSLIASVTDGILKPYLLTHTASIHNHILKPSDVSHLESSDIIFYIDNNLETFVKCFAKSNKKLVQLSEVVSLLPVRPHSFSKNITHIKDEKDLNIWLSPKNAKDIILYVSRTLSNIDEENSYKYKQNANKSIQIIDQEIEKIARELDNYKSNKYIVIQDTYQYFEKYFGLSHPSAILSTEEDSYISMKSLMKLRKIIEKENIKCVLSSSQEDVLKSKTLSNNARVVVLDPVGNLEIKPGKDAYLTIISYIAENLKSCFAGSTR